jgi:hypothetical protein
MNNETTLRKKKLEASHFLVSKYGTDIRHTQKAVNRRESPE